MICLALRWVLRVARKGVSLPGLAILLVFEKMVPYNQACDATGGQGKKRPAMQE